MLRFNFIQNFKNSIKWWISIHPMLRFNTGEIFSFDKTGTFQYILCYGSTKLWGCGIYTWLYFNTSYVTVQLPLPFYKKSTLGFQYILCYGSTQFCEKKMKEFIIFQYILCYGSTFQAIFYFIYKLLFQYILCYGSTIFLYNLR